MGIQLLDDGQSFFVGEGGLGQATAFQCKAGRGLDLFEGDAGMQGDDAGRVVGAAEVHHAKIRDDPLEVDAGVVAARNASGGVVARA